MFQTPLRWTQHNLSEIWTDKSKKCSFCPAMRTGNNIACCAHGAISIVDLSPIRRISAPDSWNWPLPTPSRQCLCLALILASVVQSSLSLFRTGFQTRRQTDGKRGIRTIFLANPAVLRSNDLLIFCGHENPDGMANEK